MFSKPHGYFITAKNYTKTPCSHNILETKRASKELASHTGQEIGKEIEDCATKKIRDYEI